MVMNRRFEPRLTKKKALNNKKRLETIIFGSITSMVVEDFAQPPRLLLLLAVSVKGKGLLCHAWFAEEPPRKEAMWVPTRFCFPSG